MDEKEFERFLSKKQEHIKRYTDLYFPVRAGEIALRFINGNFRAQGWQGQTFQRWQDNRRKGTILVKTGAGRRGTQFTTLPGQVRLFNTVGYMAVHNKGFKGTVWVPAHQRRLTGKKRVASGLFTKTGKARMKTVSFSRGSTMVKAHSRRMNLPKRQWAPESATDSPVLLKALIKEVDRSVTNILHNGEF
jgi:hypothetical protein